MEIKKNISKTKLTNPQGGLAPLKKASNPKDACGTKKVSMSVVPAEVLLEVAVALFEGARKYGRHNYRDIGVRGSVYYDATLRHLMAWWEGEDIDPDSGLSHITKAITSLFVLRDAMINEKWTDDRPPRIKDRNFMNRFNKLTENLIEKYPNALEAYTETNTQNKLSIFLNNSENKRKISIRKKLNYFKKYKIFKKL